MLHRYGDVGYIMNLDVEIGIRLICKAKEKDRDDRIFAQWAAQLPVMALSGNTVSFQDYKDFLTGANIDVRPTEVLLKEVNEIEKEFKRMEV